VVFRPPDLPRREPYPLKGVPLYGLTSNWRGIVGIGSVVLSLALGLSVSAWLGFAVFVAIFFGLLISSVRQQNRKLQDPRAADPAHPHVQLHQEWEQAIQTHGRRSRQTREARRRYERALTDYLRRTPD
jgi:hypothetical protein